MLLIAGLFTRYVAVLFFIEFIVATPLGIGMQPRQINVAKANRGASARAKKSFVV